MASSTNQRAQSKQQPGHLEIIGETAAKLRLFQQGWNPYSRFLDVDKVDLILRRSTGNNPEYREIQVKYRKLFQGQNPAEVESQLFTGTAWYTSGPDEFAHHRPGFFIMFIFGYHNRQLEEDSLIFPSRDLHEIIQLAPNHDKAGKKRSLYISKVGNGNRWFVRRTRKKFTAITSENCVDVTKYCNNFDLLN